MPFHGLFSEGVHAIYGNVMDYLSLFNLPYVLGARMTGQDMIAKLNNHTD